MIVSTRGLMSALAQKGLAAIFFRMFSQANSLRNRADDAEVVARRHQEHRDGAGHDDRVQHRRFVAVAVDHDHIPGATVECQTILFEVEVPLVTKYRWSQLKMRAALRSEAATGPGGRAAGPVPRPRCRRRRAACSRRRTGGTSGRRVTSGRPRRPNAGAMPGIRTIRRVVHQRTEEGRRQRVEIGLDSRTTLRAMNPACPRTCG